MNKLKTGIILCIILITIIIIVLINLNNNSIGNNVMNNKVENNLNHAKNTIVNNNISVEKNTTGNVSIEKPNVNETANNNTSTPNNEVKSFEDTTNQIDSTMKKNKIRNLYFSIENSINAFLKYVDIEKEEAVYSILSNDYIDEKNITSKNVLKRLEKKDGFLNFKIEEIYTIERLGSYSNFVKGVITYSNSKENWYGLIETDFDYKYYQITPYTEDEYLDKVNNVKTIEANEIKNNEYNMMSTSKISDDDMCKKYFNDYKEKMLNDTKKAYEILEEDYKNRNFKQFSEYEKYINDNRKMIETSTLEDFTVETIELSDDYEYIYEYILKDNNGNVYIITENAIMDYAVKMEE